MFAYGYSRAPAPEPGVRDARASGSRTRRRDPRARAVRRRRAGDDGRGAHARCGLLPFEQTIAEVALGARARRARPSCTPAATGARSITEGIPELDHHGLLGPDQVHVHCNTLDDRDFRRLADHGLQGLVESGDRAPDGDGPPGDRPRARARHAAEPVLRRHVLELGRHVRPDADRPPVRAMHAQRRRSTPATAMPDALELTVRDALALGHGQRRPRDGPRGPRSARSRRASRPT